MGSMINNFYQHLYSSEGVSDLDVLLHNFQCNLQGHKGDERLSQ